jgi:hypothetical protein
MSAASSSIQAWESLATTTVFDVTYNPYIVTSSPSPTSPPNRYDTLNPFLSAPNPPLNVDAKRVCGNRVDCRAIGVGLKHRIGLAVCSDVLAILLEHLSCGIRPIIFV